MERPLQKGRVSKKAGEPGGARVALRSAAVVRQHDNGKVRPRGLPVEPSGNGFDPRFPSGLLGEDRRAGAAVERLDQPGKVGHRLRRHPGLAEDRRSDRRVAPDRCQDQHTFGVRP